MSEGICGEIGQCLNEHDNVTAVSDRMGNKSGQMHLGMLPNQMLFYGCMETHLCRVSQCVRFCNFGIKQSSSLADASHMARYNMWLH